LLCLTLILCRFERVCFLGRQSPDCTGEWVDQGWDFQFWCLITRG
jgi:hypothetical protein